MSFFGVGDENTPVAAPLVNLLPKLKRRRSGDTFARIARVPDTPTREVVKAETHVKLMQHNSHVKCATAELVIKQPMTHGEKVTARKKLRVGDVTAAPGGGVLVTGTEVPGGAPMAVVLSDTAATFGEQQWRYKFKTTVSRDHKPDAVEKVQVPVKGGCAI